MKMNLKLVFFETEILKFIVNKYSCIQIVSSGLY